MPNGPKVIAVHHSFIYSNKYKCYVDCTPGNEYPPSHYIYLLSEELKDDDLSDYIDTLETEDEDGEEMWEPKFIHARVALGKEVPEEWVLSNPKHQRD